MRAAQGKLFGLQGCGHRSPAIARIHKQTGRLGPTRPRKEHGHLGIPPGGFSGTPPDTAKAMPNDCGKAPYSLAAAPPKARHGSPRKAKRRVREPAFVTPEERTASVEDCTLSCNLPQQATAYLPRPVHRGGALARPIRLRPVRRYRGEPSIARRG